MEKQKIKIDSFDMAKGVFAVLMLICHSIYGFDAPISHGIANAGAWLPLWVFDKLMKACGISMMCIICGYGYRKKSMKKAVAGQIKYIWKPYLAVALTVAVGTAVKKLLIRKSVLAGLRFSALPFLFALSFDGSYFGLEMNSIGPLWFVVMYVVSGILLNAVLQEEKTWRQICFVLLGACAGVRLGTAKLPFCLQQSLVCTLYMYLGWLMKKNKFFEQDVPRYFELTVLLAVPVLALGGTYETAINVWKSGMTDVLVGAFGGVTMLCLLLRLNRFEGWLANALRWMGRNILLLCCVHGTVYLLLPLHKLYPVFAARPLLGILSQLVIYAVTGIGGSLAVEHLTIRIRQKKQEETL